MASQHFHLKDSEIIASATDHCGCIKPFGMVGNHGWHFWVITRNFLLFLQKVRWRKEFPSAPTTEFRYDPDGEACYLGQLEAAERCPAYVAAMERKKAPESGGNRGRK